LDVVGPIVENIVFCQLKFKEEDNYKIKYWRTLSKAEVDFVLEKRNGQVAPIEVKYSVFGKPKISRSFRSFLEQYQPKNAIVLTKHKRYFQKKRQNQNGFLGLFGQYLVQFHFLLNLRKVEHIH